MYVGVYVRMIAKSLINKLGIYEIEYKWNDDTL